jgi:hypothetical protein
MAAHAHGRFLPKLAGISIEIPAFFRQASNITAMSDDKSIDVNSEPRIGRMIPFRCHDASRFPNFH